MRTLLIGIDSGTQSTKALVVDAASGKVLGSASVAHGLLPGLPPGAKEQHPHSWRDATAKAIQAALKQAKAKAAEVKAIGVSGQQHGFVPLDRAGEVRDEVHAQRRLPGLARRASRVALAAAMAAVAGRRERAREGREREEPRPEPLRGLGHVGRGDS